MAVFDPELLEPIQQSLHGQRPGILEEIPPDLPQFGEYYLNRPSRTNLTTGKLVRMALEAYDTATEVIGSGKRVSSGYAVPTIAKVKVKQFPVHRDTAAEETLMISDMFGFKVDQARGKPPKLNIFMRAGWDDSTMARIGYYDLGRPDRGKNYPFMNESGTLGYKAAQEVTRHAMVRLDDSVFTNRWD